MNESWIRNELVLNIVSEWVKPNYISTNVSGLLRKDCRGAPLQHYFEKSRSAVDISIRLHLNG